MKKYAAGPLQTCAGHGAGAEAAIHAMREIFEKESTDAVLLIDATNAFNSMNRAVSLHNVRITCPYNATYLINTYRCPARLFIAGGGEIQSEEGTTQGNPLAMPWYSLSTVNLITDLKLHTSNVSQVWLADDAAAAGKIKPLHQWYERLTEQGKKFGYLVNGIKSWLIVKSEQLANEARAVFGDSVNITTEGKRHLGAVIGSTSYKQEYCEEIVHNWVSQLKVLCDISQTQPQAASTVFTKAFCSKFTYFMRTIENFENFVTPIDDIVYNVFIPTLFGIDTPLDNSYRNIISQSPKNGGLGIQNLSQDANSQHQSSKLVTRVHVESIIEQRMVMKETDCDGNTQKDLKTIDKTAKLEMKKLTLNKAVADTPQ